MNKGIKVQLAKEYITYLKNIGSDEINESLTVKMGKAFFNPCYYELVQYRWIPTAQFNVEGNHIELGLDDYLNSDLFY